MSKWLLSMLKTSGSKRYYVSNGRYADTRHSKKGDVENWPSRESIRSTMKVYNGKINTSILKRWLDSQVGRNWEDVYSEYVLRIPAKLRDMEDVIFWYVADKVRIDEEGVWNLKKSEYIGWLSYMDYYVHPDTNHLVAMPLIRPEPDKEPCAGEQ